MQYYIGFVFFLRRHFEASLHHACWFGLDIIHLEAKLQCIFDACDQFDIKKKVTIVALESLCVASNAFLT